jgi:hypothetical protein
VTTDIYTTTPHSRRGQEVAVGIRFDLTKLTQTQKDMLWALTRALRCLGIGFDTGSDGAVLDWEWDWSLRGPVKVTFKNFVGDDPQNRYVREVLQPSVPGDLSSRLGALQALEQLVKSLSVDKDKPDGS